MSIDLLFRETNRLVGIFSSKRINLQNVLFELIKKSDDTILIIDTNHRWHSDKLSKSMFILRPQTRKDLLNILQTLPEYFHPRLKYIIVDDLPVYFRDFYKGDTFQNQNMRAYSVSLSLLKKHSHTIPILFCTYHHGFFKNDTILPHHTRYYADKLYRVDQYDQKYSLISLPDQQIILDILL